MTTDLDELTTVVLAPNPGPMTLDGTNTYLVGAPGAGDVVVVDPGPLDDRHRRAIDEALATREAEVAAVVVTHHHADHAEGASWAGEWGAPLYAFTPSLLDVDAVPLPDAASVRVAGVSIDTLHTPGHASDHLCLRVDETGVVLTGDHILGRGTTVVAWPDGDMAAYLDSLRRLATVPATALYPGHGPRLDDPARVIADYLAHRREREAQIVTVVGDDGPVTPAEIVGRVYADVDPGLHPAAERSVRAHLDQLVAEGRLQRLVDPSRPERQERYRVG